VDEQVEILGKCPLCQGTLTRKKKNLVCENGDYMVDESRWDDLWQGFEQQMNLRAGQYFKAAVTELLLQDLRDLNLITK
jgi:hypothetical protein